jgi:hypothetical protein
MTPRQLRRAAERKANKLARKGNQTVTQNAPANPITVPTPAAEPVETAATPISPAKLAANQANAQLSSGPRTEAGKQISSLNALKTALTGKTVLLPTDDVAAYETLTSQVVNDFNPATPGERTLVQSLIDTLWRLERITNLEFALYTKGSIEFADEFSHLEPATRSHMILAETFLKYEKSLRNLNTQEARLHRKLAKDTAELERLQAERREQEAQGEAARAPRAANTLPPQPSQPQSAPVGFEFSNSEAATLGAPPSLEISLEQAA